MERSQFDFIVPADTSGLSAPYAFGSEFRFCATANNTPTDVAPSATNNSTDCVAPYVPYQLNCLVAGTHAP